MTAYDETTYGERIAGVYDAWYGDYDEAAIDLLSELAAGGRALELGIGTGRVALPLKSRGVEVHGIDASQAMLSALRLKPGGESIPVTLGSFADFSLEPKFPLVYVVFNTLFALLTQDEQVSCFHSVARCLAPGGVFVVEAFVPDLARFDRGQTVRALQISEDVLRLDASQHDLAAQQVIGQHTVITEKGVRLYPVRLRYIWPSEMDLMARLAGMQLRQRWGGWSKAAYNSLSGKHISVYAAAA